MTVRRSGFSPMSTPAPPRDRPSWANVVRRFRHDRAARPVSGLRAGSGRGGRVHVGDCRGAKRVRGAGAKTVSACFRDGYRGKGQAGRLKPRTVSLSKPPQA